MVSWFSFWESVAFTLSIKNTRTTWNKKRALDENHTAQNTNEILSRYLLYAAGNCKASEIEESYAARGYEASEISQLSEAKIEKASEHRKPRHEGASETKRTLKAVCKRLEAEEAREYEARSEEATERRTQQECILSGGVYLRHRLRKSSFSL